VHTKVSISLGSEADRRLELYFVSFVCFGFVLEVRGTIVTVSSKYTV